MFLTIVLFVLCFLTVIVLLDQDVKNKLFFRHKTNVSFEDKEIAYLPSKNEDSLDLINQYNYNVKLNDETYVTEGNKYVVSHLVIEDDKGNLLTKTSDGLYCWQNPLPFQNLTVSGKWMHIVDNEVTESKDISEDISIHGTMMMSSIIDSTTIMVTPTPYGVKLHLVV